MAVGKLQQKRRSKRSDKAKKRLESFGNRLSAKSLRIEVPSAEEGKMKTKGLYVQGYLDGKLIYSSKNVQDGYAGSLKQRWLRRKAKQLANRAG